MRYISFMLLLCNLGHAQIGEHIKGCNYEGYIFDENHLVLMSVENQCSRYTPKNTDINFVEQLLRDSIGVLQRSIPYLTKKKLSKYKRQYVGFLNKDNEIIIWINFFKSSDITLMHLSQDIIQVYDGGSNYWSIFINLSKNKLFNMRVNGAG